MNRSLRGAFVLFCKTLLGTLTALEKLILLAALLITIASIPLSIKARAALENSTPLPGGIYTEGVLVKTQADLEQSARRLTARGLISFDEEGRIVPDLAKTVELNKDRTEFVFRFEPDKNLPSLRDLLSTLPPYEGAEIFVTDDKTILVKFSKTNLEFLDLAASAHVPFGPYRQIEQSDTMLTFERNADFFTPPFVSRIVLVPYEDAAKLETALRNKTVDGTWGLRKGVEGKGLKSYDAPSGLKVIVFFNTTADGQKRPDERRAVRDGTVQNRTIRVLAKDGPAVAAALDEWRQRLAQHQSTLEVTAVTAQELSGVYAQDQTYDAVALIADLSADAAPRAFWHSNQLAPLGQNYARWFDPQMDDAIEEFERATDDHQRLALRERMQAALERGVPAMIVSPPPTRYTLTDQLKGVTLSPVKGFADRFGRVEDWYLKDKKVR